MNIIKFNQYASADHAMEHDEPLIAVVAFDGTEAIFSHIDEAVEHQILLGRSGHSSKGIDKYFRIVFDRSGADWTFVCPHNYKNINDKTKRIAQFYKDGFAEIASFLAQIGYLIDINIPKRYRRHFDGLSGERRSCNG
ncbi:MAG: hypothetical protein FWH14_03885 [Oscillospiraceae bacterium]|nr:hypothetical protein [Oscillospiraceae bacterium]